MQNTRTLGARVGVTAPARRFRANAERLPVPVTALVIAIFLPEALSFYVFDLRLTLARLIPLVLFPVLLPSFARLITSRGYRLVLSDIFMPLTALWMIIAPTFVSGFAAALKSGGILALEFVGPYLVVRCFVRTIGQVHRTAALFCTVAALVGPLGLLDTLAQRPVLREELARLTGYVYYAAGVMHDIADYYRLGLYRAEGVFEHPILFGIGMCYALMLVGDLRGPRRILCLLGSGFGLFLSLSSAPWMATAIGAGLLTYRRIARSISRRWLLAIGSGMIAVMGIFVVSKNPFGFLFSHLTLDPATGYYRLLIWQYAGWDLLQSPYFGLGLNTAWIRPDWMSASVDSYWLTAAMLYGIPGSVLTGLSFICASSLPVRISNRNAQPIGEREVRLAEALGIIIFLTVFLGFTVHYWGICSLMLSLLVALRAALGEIAYE